MADLLITRPPSREEAARAAHRQDEDDRLNAANRVYRSLLDDAAAFALQSSVGEDHRYRYLVESVVRQMRWHLGIVGANAIVAPYARALREQAETITRREQIIEKPEDAQ